MNAQHIAESKTSVPGTQENRRASLPLLTARPLCLVRLGCLSPLFGRVRLRHGFDSLHLVYGVLFFYGIRLYVRTTYCRAGQN